MEENQEPRAMAIKPKLIKKKMLSKDERVVFQSRPSWWWCMKAPTLFLLVVLAANILLAWKLVPSAPELPYLSSAIGGSMGGVTQAAFAAIAIIALIVALWFFYMRWLRLRKTAYIATDERIITQTGIMGKEYEDIPVTHIENIRMSQTLGEWFLGYGTLKFSSEGFEEREGKGVHMVWEAVPKPAAVRTILQDVMDIRVKPNRDKPTR